MILDDFTRSYIEAAIWSSNDGDGNPLDENYNVDDLSSATLQTTDTSGGGRRRSPSLRGG